MTGGFGRGTLRGGERNIREVSRLIEAGTRPQEKLGETRAREETRCGSATEIGASICSSSFEGTNRRPDPSFSDLHFCCFLSPFGSRLVLLWLPMVLLLILVGIVFGVKWDLTKNSKGFSHCCRRYIVLFPNNILFVDVPS